MKIGFKITGIIFIGFVILTAIIIMIVNLQIRDLTANLVEDQLNKSTKVLETSVVDDIDEIVKILERFSKDPSLLELISSSYTDIIINNFKQRNKELNPRTFVLNSMKDSNQDPVLYEKQFIFLDVFNDIENFTISLENVKKINIIDKNGTIILGSDITTIGSSLKLDPNLLSSLNNKEYVISKAIINPDKSVFLQVIVPIKLNNIILGYITNEFALYNVLNSALKTNTPIQYLYILDDDGIIINHPNQDLIGINIKDLPSDLYKQDEWINREDGIINYTYKGVDKFAYMLAVPDKSMNFFVGINPTNFNIYLNTITLMMIAVSFFIIVIILLSISFILNRQILKPIKDQINLIYTLSQGKFNITKEESKFRKDEIGLLASSIHKLDNQLSKTLKNVSSTQNFLTQNINILNESVEDIIDTVELIKINVDHTLEQTQQQKELSNGIESILNEDKSSLKEFNNTISLQASSIEESSSAIEEMMGNITSITKMTNNAGSLAEKLKFSGVQGQKLQDNAIEQIQNLNDGSKKLKDANSLISSIAEQTNLLAMNAAIEAAHAGEFGVGFAVVAEEIRVLAEQSGEQSASVGKTIKFMIDTIAESSKVSNLASESFREIIEKIQELTIIVQQIQYAMEEQNTGTQEILNAVSSMKNSSHHVQETNFRINNSNQNITLKIEELTKMSNIINNDIEKIVNSIKKINNEVEIVADLSKNNEDSINKSNEALSFFSVN